MDEDEAVVEVVVDEADEAPDTVVDVEPVIVVETAEDSGNDSTDAVVVERTIDHEGRIAALEGAVSALIEDVTQLTSAAETQAAMTEAVVDTVVTQAETVEEMGDAVAETAADTVDDAPDLDGDGEPDVPPETARQHWMFRTRDQWRRK